jgi:hypothetical protein
MVLCILVYVSYVGAVIRGFDAWFSQQQREGRSDNGIASQSNVCHVVMCFLHLKNHSFHLPQVSSLYAELRIADEATTAMVKLQAHRTVIRMS